MIIAPWNPTGNHWVLIVIFISSFEAIYLDPMLDNKCLDNLRIKKAQEMFGFLIKHRFSKEKLLSWSIPDHTLQDDSLSCGVMVCWYGNVLANNGDITAQVDKVEQRKNIFFKIVGNCLKDSTDHFTHKDKISCRECRNSNGNDWIECVRCQQWYHCACVGLTNEEANIMKVFHCP